MGVMVFHLSDNSTVCSTAYAENMKEKENNKTPPAPQGADSI